MQALRSTSFLGLLALALSTTSIGCPGPDDTATEPSIVSFATSAATITGSGTATLSWETTDTMSVAIADAAGTALDLAGAPAAAGSVDVTLDTLGTYVYTLTATGEEGSTPATANVSITVEAEPAPLITAFAATPASITLGQSSTLAWTTTDADTVTMVDGLGNTVDLTGEIADAGSIDVSPTADTVYTLTAVGPGGTATDTVTVAVPTVASILTFSSGATGPIVGGTAVVLSWTTANTDSITMVDDASNPIDLSGLTVAGDSVTVNPGVSTTYTLTATNTNGSNTADVTVDVLTAIVSFSLTPNTARAGDTVTLDWQVGGTTAADISGPDGFAYTVPAGELLTGSTTATAGSPGDFVLSATGPLNNDSWTETLAITTAPRIRTFTATPANITEGDSTTLAWDVDGATTLDLVDSLGSTLDISALAVTTDSIAQTLVVPGTVTYTLTATNVDGNDVLTADVVVDAIPTIDAFAAVPTRVASGADTTLSWMTTNAASVRLEENSADLGIPATDLNASYGATGLSADSTYILYAANSLGVEVASAPLTVTVGAPLNVSFVAVPPAAAPSDTVQLNWTNDGGTTVTVNDGTSDVCVVNVLADVADGGCSVTAPAAIGTYPYTLTVSDGAGGSDTASVDLFVSDGPIIRLFDGSAVTISEGDILTLSWIVDNDPAGNLPTLGLTDDQGTTYDLSAANPNADSGDVTGLAAGTYVFTLTATTGVGTDASGTFTVTVIALPTILTFDANPRSLDTQGGTVVPTTDIGWTTQDGVVAELWELDATGAPVMPAVHVAANQSEVDGHTLASYPLTFTTVFRLHVENTAGGFVEADVSVIVDGPVVATFEATFGGAPVTEIVAGEIVDLSWTTQRADTASLDPMPMLQTAGLFQDLTATGTPLVFNDADFGEATVTFPAGFTFPYFGAARTELVATSDGYISFDITTSSTGDNDPIPSIGTPNGGVIAAFWDDLDMPAGGAAFTEHQVNAGGPDAFVISWQGTQVYATSATLNFQIVLWDNGDFGVNYGTMTGSGADQALADGGGAAAGFEDDTGDRGVEIARNTPWPGGLSNIGWSVQASVPVSGTVQVSPLGDTTYTLTASSASGTDSASLGLIIHPPAQIMSTGTNPAQPEEGLSFDLTWNTQDATQVVVTDAGGTVLCTATLLSEVVAGGCPITEATPGTYDYTVTATGALPRDTISTVQTVTVWPLLEINTWSVTDGSVTDSVEIFVSGGTPITLAWDVAGAVGFTIVSSVDGDLTPGGWGATGTLAETPTQTTTYTLSISDDALFGVGSRRETASVTVYVDAAQITSFGASTTQSAAGASVDLSWATSGTVDSLSITPFNVATTTGNTFTSIAAAVGAVDVTPASMDGGSSILNLTGFNFPFDGQVFSDFLVDANGFLAFDTALAGTYHDNDPIPTAADPDGGLIAGYWDDLDGQPGISSIWYQVSGIPGSQTLIVQWTAFEIWFQGGTLTFQVVLHENGDFEINYLQMTENGAGGTVGFENIAANGGFELVNDTASPALVADGVGHLFQVAPLPASGTTSVTPQQTTTYEVCATGGGYTDCQTVTIAIVEIGDIMVSEFMADPAVAAGEWFEVYNSTANPLDLEGWTIRDDGGQSHVIANGAPLMVPAGGFLVLASDGSAATNGGVTADYAYGVGFTLELPADQIVLESMGVEIDRLAWDATWTVPVAATLSFDTFQAGDSAANDLPVNWCTESGAYGAGGAGSPGAGGACFTTVRVSSSPGLAIPDAGSTGSPCDATGAAVDSIVVADTSVITDADVVLDVVHTYDGDLHFWLEFDNAGTPVCIELSTGNGSSGADYDQTILDDEAATSITAGTAPFAGSYQPESPLSALDGLPMNGVWTLFVSDDAGFDTGTLEEWALIISF